MNYSISKLYIKFMEIIEPYLNKYPYILGVVVGGIFFGGAIFKWKWICENRGSTNFMITIYEFFGEKGIRFFTGLLGAIIMLVCLFLWLKK